MGRVCSVATKRKDFCKNFSQKELNQGNLQGLLRLATFILVIGDNLSDHPVIILKVYNLVPQDKMDLNHPKVMYLLSL